MPNRAVWAEIDVTAIRHNIREIKGRVQNGAMLCAVVKADAYGHGAAEVAKIAAKESVDYLAVAVLSEAITLRDSGCKTPILILGFTPAEQAAIVVDRGITQTVFTFEMAAALSEAAAKRNKKVKVHLKIDTGMGRIGILPEEAGALAARIAGLPMLELEGMFSHFATADSEDKTFAYEQLVRFQEAVSSVEARGIFIPIKHLANSAAILDMPEAHFNMVRAGVILYGLWPSAEMKKSADLRPAMCLKARVAYVKTVLPMRGISYGSTFVTARDSVIATLPIGYADGYTRRLSGLAMVEIHGQRVPVVGRICMDQCMVDVTGVSEVKAGDEVILFGSKQIPIDEIADLLGTIHYEIVCMVSNRVPRVYI